jgi:hypothetical protein
MLDMKKNWDPLKAMGGVVVIEISLSLNDIFSLLFRFCKC